MATVSPGAFGNSVHDQSASASLDLTSGTEAGHFAPAHAYPLSRQPACHRAPTESTHRLNQRLSEIWANPDVYRAICSDRFGSTLADLFFYDFRQLANDVSHVQC
jgi:hypothetical protein